MNGATSCNNLPDPLIDGNHTLTITAIDDAGNVGSDSIIITVDTTAPTVFITNISDSQYINGIVQIDANADDAGTGISQVDFWYASIGEQFDSDPVAPYSGDFNSKVVNDGAHQLWAVAHDNAGNSQSSTHINVNVDNTAPTTTLVTSNYNGNWVNYDVNFQLYCNDGSGSGCDSVWYSIDGDNFVNGDSGVILSDDYSGEFDFEYYSIDLAGNQGDTNTATIRIDVSEPSISIQSPVNNAVYVQDFNLEFTANDWDSGLGECSYSINGLVSVGVNCDTETPIDFNSLNEGRNTIYITAIDVLGNQEDKTVSFVKDTDLVVTVDQNESNNPDFSNILDAYTAVGENYTIIVNDGTYYIPRNGVGVNTIDISKPVTIKSVNGKDKTIITNSSGDKVIEVNNTSGVVIDGFTINGINFNPSVRINSSANVVIQNSTITGGRYVMYLYSSSQVSLINNTMADGVGNELNPGYGIYVWGVTDSTISNNQITNNSVGIFVQNLREKDSNNIQITDNNISGNLFDGILVESGQNIIVKHNQLYDNSQSAPTTSMHNDSDEFVDARYNWWNTTNLGEIFADTYGNVLYAPWCIDQDCNAYSRGYDVNADNLTDLLDTGIFMPQDGTNPYDTNAIETQEDVFIWAGETYVKIPKGTVISRTDGNNMDATKLVADSNVESLISNLGA